MYYDVTAIPSTIKELQLRAINGQTIAIINDAKKLLQSKSFHFGNPNDFDGIHFGENKYGINFACLLRAYYICGCYVSLMISSMHLLR
jgi:hypothetical protein